MPVPSRIANPEAEAIATIGGVLTDLAELSGRLPVPAAEAEHSARILDRLSEEIADAATLLRAAHNKPLADRIAEQAMDVIDRAVSEGKLPG